jgi:hypothetical protein
MVVPYTTLKSVPYSCLLPPKITPYDICTSMVVPYTTLKTYTTLKIPLFGLMISVWIAHFHLNVICFIALCWKWNLNSGHDTIWTKSYSP